MWKVSPTSWLSHDYEVTDHSLHVARMAFRWLGAGSIKTPTSRLTIQREGFWKATYSLRGGSARRTDARPSGAFRRGFLLSWEGKDYRLSPTSPFGRGYTLFRHSRPLGEVRAVGFLSRSARANLKVELPLELRLFAVWLTLQAWRRAAAAAAS